jgi:hypothetical protein
MLLNRQNLLICDLCGKETQYLEVQPDGSTLAVGPHVSAYVSAPKPPRKILAFRRTRNLKRSVLFHRQTAEMMRIDVYKRFYGKNDGLGGYECKHVPDKAGVPPRFDLDGGGERFTVFPRPADVPTSLALPSELNPLDEYVDTLVAYIEVPFLISHLHEELSVRVRKYLGYLPKYDRKSIVAQALDLHVRKTQRRGIIWGQDLVDDPFATLLNALPTNQDLEDDYLDTSLRSKAGHWGEVVRKDIFNYRRYVHMRLNYVLLKRVARLTKSFMSNDREAEAQLFVPNQKLDRKSPIKPLVVRALNDRTGQELVIAQMPLRPAY